MPITNQNFLPRLAVLLLPFTALTQQNAVLQPQAWGPRAGAFQLSIAASQSVFDSGQAVKIEAVLKNVSAYSVPRRRIGGVLPYTVEVLLPSATWLPFRSHAQLTKEAARATDVSLSLGLFIKDLAPGQSATDSVDVASIYDMSVPGEYLITFQCQQPTGTGDDLSHLVDVRSNQLKITIRRP